MIKVIERNSSEIIAAGEAFLQTDTGRANFTGPVTLERRGKRFNVVIAVPALVTTMGTFRCKGSVFSLDPDDIESVFAI